MVVGEAFAFKDIIVIESTIPRNAEGSQWKIIFQAERKLQFVRTK